MAPSAHHALYSQIQSDPATTDATMRIHSSKTPAFINTGKLIAVNAQLINLQFNRE